MSFKKVLTLPTIVSTSAGLTFATSCFVAAVQVASFLAGDSAWIAILVAGVLSLLAGVCFSELNGILPSVAGLRLYFTRAYNDSFSLAVSIFYMFVIVTVMGAESYVLSRVLNYTFPAVPSFLWIVVMVAIVVLLNIRGIKIAGRFQDVITYGLISSLLVLAVLALSKNSFTLVQPLAVGSADSLISAIAVGVFLFIGFEWVTPLAEEVTHIKLISKGMLIALGILSVTYGLFTVAMTNIVPKDQLVGSPIPHVLFGQNLLGTTGLTWMVILSLAATITTFNAGMISTSRFVYATAREYGLPPVFSRLSNKYYTPWVAIVAVALVGLTASAAVFGTGRYVTMVNVGAALESLIYALAGLAVLRLRKKMPDVERPFKIWGGPVVPILTLLVFAFLMVAVFSEDVWAAAYLAAGLVVCAAYVRFVVPKLKAKYQKPKRASRRPRPAEPGEVVKSSEVVGVGVNQSDEV